MNRVCTVYSYIAPLLDTPIRVFADKLIEHKWESAITVDRHSWGFRANMVQYDTNYIYYSNYCMYDCLLSSSSAFASYCTSPACIEFTLVIWNSV